jgi:hypothetical protein
MIYHKNFKNTRFLWNKNFILFSVFLVSCDSIHTFSIYNKSDRGKYLEVIGVLNVNDSVIIQEPEMNGKLEQTKLIPSLSKNEEKRSFSFYLPPKNKANIEFGWGAKPTTKQVIVNKTDTIIIKKSKGKVKRQPFPTSNYVLILKD